MGDMPLTSRPYQPNLKACCERCVFGSGLHAEWCGDYYVCAKCGREREILRKRGMNGYTGCTQYKPCAQCGHVGIIRAKRTETEAIADFVVNPDTRDMSPDIPQSVATRGR